LHPRRGMTAGPEEEIALLMRRWEQVLRLHPSKGSIWSLPARPTARPGTRLQRQIRRAFIARCRPLSTAMLRKRRKVLARAPSKPKCRSCQGGKQQAEPLLPSGYDVPAVGFFLQSPWQEFGA
jgi:hypothetical protein